MLGFSIEILVSWLLLFLVISILVLLLSQLTRLCSKFLEARNEFEANIAGLIAIQKKISTTQTALLAEQKRLSRLTLEGLDLKRAEMTGDFEIVEEPIPAATSTASATEAAPKTPEPAPSQFPKIQ